MDDEILVLGPQKSEPGTIGSLFGFFQLPSNIFHIRHNNFFIPLMLRLVHSARELPHYIVFGIEFTRFRQVSLVGLVLLVVEPPLILDADP